MIYPQVRYFRYDRYERLDRLDRNLSRELKAQSDISLKLKVNNS
jgi:hypothetical protein